MIIFSRQLTSDLGMQSRDYEPFSFVPCWGMLRGPCHVCHESATPLAVLPKTSISPLKAVCRRFMELSYQNQFHVYYSNTSVRPKLQYEIRFYAVNNVMLTVFFWLLCAFFSRISRGKYVFLYYMLISTTI